MRSKVIFHAVIRASKEDKRRGTSDEGGAVPRVVVVGMVEVYAWYMLP